MIEVFIDSQDFVHADSAIFWNFIRISASLVSLPQEKLQSGLNRSVEHKCKLICDDRKFMIHWTNLLVKHGASCLHSSMEISSFCMHLAFLEYSLWTMIQDSKAFGWFVLINHLQNNWYAKRVCEGVMGYFVLIEFNIMAIVTLSDDLWTHSHGTVIALITRDPWMIGTHAKLHHPSWDSDWLNIIQANVPLFCRFHGLHWPLLWKP